MLEIVIVVGLIALAYFIFIAAKFVNFKSKLMNEFGRHGVSFELADRIYYQYREEIHDLHNQGISLNQIVEELAKRGSAGLGREHDEVSELPLKTAAAGREEKLQSIVLFVVGTLSVQKTLISNEDGSLPQRATDAWSIGYVSGTADAVLQLGDFKPDAECEAVIGVVFLHVFGEPDGREFIRKFNEYQSLGDKVFMEGMKAGGQDVYDFLKDSNRSPIAWSNHVHSLTK